MFWCGFACGGILVGVCLFCEFVRCLWVMLILDILRNLTVELCFVWGWYCGYTLGLFCWIVSS